MVDALPAIVEAAAKGIAGSNLTILNGSDGVNQVVTELVGQGLSILDTLRRSTAAAGASAGHNGATPAPTPAVSAPDPG